MATIIVEPDLVIRGEADATTSIVVRVTMRDRVAFGAAFVASADPHHARSTRAITRAQARAWHALARAADDPGVAYDAAAQGLALLAPCATESMPTRPRSGLAPDARDAREATRVLEDRLRCDGRTPRGSAESVVIDRDLVVRAEADGAVSVLAIATLGDRAEAGVARLHATTLQDAATSLFADVARARAWQLRARGERDPSVAREALERGVRAVNTCAETSRGLYRAGVAAREGRTADAIAALQQTLERGLVACVRRYHDHVL